MRRNATLLAGLMLAILLLTLVGRGPAWAAPKGSPWGATYFPNVPLLTQDGQTVHFYDDLLKDKIVVINFIYTHCKDACPLQTAKLAQVQKLLGARMGQDIFFYSLTIDPKRDTPAVLKKYAEQFQVGPGWTFLTGKKADLDLIRKKVGLYATHDTDDPFYHTTNIVLGNEATGQWIRNSAFDNPQFVAVMIGDWLDSWKAGKVGRSYAEVPKLPTPEKGQYLFQTRCAACHTLGQGDGVGPDLLGVTHTRDHAWLARWLAVPDQMLAEQDPLAAALLAQYRNVPMPNLHLTAVDVDALLAYLEAQTAARAEADRKASVAQLPARSSESAQEQPQSERSALK